MSGPLTPKAPLEWWLVTATVAMLVLDAAVVALVGVAVDGWVVAREFLFAIGWLIVGVIAVRVNRARFGRLTLLFAFVLAGTLTPTLGLSLATPITNGLMTVAAVLFPLQFPLIGHVLLAFSNGEVPERAARGLLVVGYGVAAIDVLAVIARQKTPRPDRCVQCARSLLLGDGPWPAPITQFTSAAWVPLAAGLITVLALRLRRATRRQRRVLLVPYAASLIAAIVFAGTAAAGAAIGGGPFAGSGPAVIALQSLVWLAVPVCFLVGLVLDRTAQARVGHLVQALAGDGTDVRSALAATLGDPDLLVAFPADGGLVDTSGIPVVAPVHAAATPVGTDDPPLAVIFHDPALSEERDLLSAAVSAAWLALDHARLQALVRAQLRDVRESRARLVAASDEARRRVERDLHDGAQQRLLAAGLALRMLHDRTTLAGAEAQLLTEAENELRDAMRELRELAAGIHPAVLTEQGLYPALAVLAARCPITMHLQGQEPQGLSAATQAAVYFAVNEAVTNAAKHAGTTECTVRLTARATTLVVDVVDEGVGGANPSGHGLRGIADRLAVVDGLLSVHSPAGSGTRIHMEVPCASS